MFLESRLFLREKCQRIDRQQKRKHEIYMRQKEKKRTVFSLLVYSLICSFDSELRSGWFDDFLLLLDLSFERRWWPCSSSALSRRERFDDFLWWPWRDDELPVELIVFTDGSLSSICSDVSTGFCGDSVDDIWLVPVFDGERRAERWLRDESSSVRWWRELSSRWCRLRINKLQYKKTMKRTLLLAWITFVFIISISWRFSIASRSFVFIIAATMTWTIGWWCTIFGRWTTTRRWIMITIISVPFFVSIVFRCFIGIVGIGIRTFFFRRRTTWWMIFGRRTSTRCWPTVASICCNSYLWRKMTRRKTVYSRNTRSLK